jgi:hypothetical protein
MNSYLGQRLILLTYTHTIILYTTQIHRYVCMYMQSGHKEHKEISGQTRSDPAKLSLLPAAHMYTVAHVMQRRIAMRTPIKSLFVLAKLHTG